MLGGDALGQRARVAAGVGVTELGAVHATGGLQPGAQRPRPVAVAKIAIAQAVTTDNAKPGPQPSGEEPGSLPQLLVPACSARMTCRTIDVASASHTSGLVLLTDRNRNRET